MSEPTSAAILGIAALAEPNREALYRYVVGQPGAVGREQAAEAVGLAAHSAKFHLDRLVEDGLLEVEFRRLTGRTGPGAGRPAKLYRRSPREFAVSLPERSYDLAGQILASAVERATREAAPVSTAVREVALARGREVGGAEPRTATEAHRTVAALAGQGYEPRPVDQEIRLANCPFDALAREHTELVCGMNQAFVTGVLDGLGCTTLEARLDPAPDLCCVRVGPPAERDGADSTTAEQHQ